MMTTPRVSLSTIREHFPILEYVTEEQINNNYVKLIDIIQKINDCDECNKANKEIENCYRENPVVDEGRICIEAGPCPAHQKQAKQAKIERLIKDANLSRRFKYCSFSKYNVKEGNNSAYQVCKAYAESYSLDSNGLFLFGPPGTGKTHLAVSILQEVLKKEHNGMIITVSDLFYEIKKSLTLGNEVNKILEKVKKIEFLVLDDLGAEKETDFVIETLYQIINFRYN